MSDFFEGHGFVKICGFAVHTNMVSAPGADGKPTGDVGLELVHGCQACGAEPQTFRLYLPAAAVQDIAQVMFAAANAAPEQSGAKRCPEGDLR